MRASLYVEGARGEKLVIDTGPEFRLQALRAGIERLDAALLTHAHADHLHGLDDLRPLSQEKPLPVYGNGETIGELREKFSYIFRETQRGGGKPRLKPLAATGTILVGGLSLAPLPVKHGTLDILGWLIEEEGFRAAYLTDTSAIPAATGARIRGLDLLIIGGLRVRPQETHFSFQGALDAALELGAQRVYLTHLCHEHSHREAEDFCRAYLADRGLAGPPLGPAYDGLGIELGPGPRENP
jgi:phosphoribosyl 1,2-cyclic phosphate phosphodiesterase